MEKSNPFYNTNVNGTMRSGAIPYAPRTANAEPAVDFIAQQAAEFDDAVNTVLQRSAEPRVDPRRELRDAA